MEEQVHGEEVKGEEIYEEQQAHQDEGLHLAQAPDFGPGTAAAHPGSGRH